jgi:hypothetical protein
MNPETSLAAPSRVRIYEAFDAVRSNYPAVPRGTFGPLFAAIDDLRSSAAPYDQIATAERLSVEVHDLGSALLSRDEDAQTEARTSTGALWSHWCEISPAFADS